MSENVNHELIELILSIKPECADRLEQKQCRFIEDLGFDSISLIGLLVEVEEKFGVSFDEEDDFIENFYSVDSLLEKLYMLTENNNE